MVEPSDATMAWVYIGFTLFGAFLLWLAYEWLKSFIWKVVVAIVNSVYATDNPYGEVGREHSRQMEYIYHDAAARRRAREREIRRMRGW